MDTTAQTKLPVLAAGAPAGQDPQPAPQAKKALPPGPAATPSGADPASAPIAPTNDAPQDLAGAPPDPVRTSSQLLVTAASVLDDVHQIVEVTIIRPGMSRAMIDGKPVIYTDEALQASIPMWEGAACFCDHFNKSVRNIVGVFFNVRYLEGVRAKLRFIDQALYKVITRIVRDREAGLAVPDVGLSADVLIDGESAEDGLTVTRIARVISADIVFCPAAGGSFDRVLNCVRQELGIEGPVDAEGPDPAEGYDAPAGERLVPEKRVRDLQSTADRLRNQVREKESTISGLRGDLTEAVEKYRQSLLRQHPEVPEGLVGGATAAELDASLQQALAMVENVRKHLTATVPAGAPARHEADMSSMTPADKIGYGLRKRGLGS